MDVNGCIIFIIFSVGDISIDIDLMVINGDCGDNSFIIVSIFNGMGFYQISWVGEVEGFVIFNSLVYIIENLLGSFYVVIVQDVNGCIVSDNIMVVSGFIDFEVVYIVSNNGCGVLNNIWMDFFNGVGLYIIEWIGLNFGMDVIFNDYYDIQNVVFGVYIIIVMDVIGCVDVQWVEVINIFNIFNVIFSLQDGFCGSMVSIGVFIEGGFLWYIIVWNLGIQFVGEVDINLNYYIIDDLEGGIYYVWVIDENGCQCSVNVMVNMLSNLFQVDVMVVGFGCNILGLIGFIMNGGEGLYDIIWLGIELGSVMVNSGGYIIFSLDGGDYYVYILDVNGCYNNFFLMVLGSIIGNLEVGFSYIENDLMLSF